MRVCFALFSLVVLFEAPVAAAKTITFTYDQASDTDFLQPFGPDLVQYPIDPFNRSLGSLSSITFHYDYDANIQYAAPPYMGSPASNGGYPYYGADAQYLFAASTFNSGYLDLPFTVTGISTPQGIVDTASLSLHPVVTVTGPDLATYLSGADTFEAFQVNVTPQFQGGGVATGIEFSSMSVTYDYVPAVPELAAWELMTAGAGVIGLFMRQRRRSAAPRYA